MTNPDERRPDLEKFTDWSFVPWLIALIVLLVLSAAWFFTYPFPGKEATVLGFVVLWWKELVILAFFLIVLVAVLAQKFRKSIDSPRADI